MAISTFASESNNNSYTAGNCFQVFLIEKEKTGGYYPPVFLWGSFPADITQNPFHAAVLNHRSRNVYSLSVIGVTCNCIAINMLAFLIEQPVGIYQHPVCVRIDNFLHNFLFI